MSWIRIVIGVSIGANASKDGAGARAVADLDCNFYWLSGGQPPQAPAIKYPTPRSVWNRFDDLAVGDFS